MVIYHAAKLSAHHHAGAYWMLHAHTWFAHYGFRGLEGVEACVTWDGLAAGFYVVA